MKAVLLLRPNIALFSTDAMPVNCSPQPRGSQHTSDDQCDRHPQDITHMVRKTRPASPVRQQVEETLYARFFLPVKREVTENHPETPSPERSADLAPGGVSDSNPIAAAHLRVFNANTELSRVWGGDW
ncbi:hypothetical protein FRC08_010205, partial [Ceratobasidium sp. 394]